MKIEIDFSKPEALKKLKRELEMALQTIDGALTAILKGRASEAQTTFQITPEVTPPDASGDVSALIGLLPDKFNMREAKSAADIAEIPDSKLRREIAKMIESGALILEEKGQGRRPASYRKA